MLLQLLVKSESLIKLLSSLPHVLYFGKLACHARNLWQLLDSRIEEISKDAGLATAKEYGKLEALVDQSRQLLLYADEIVRSLPELAHVRLHNSQVVSNALLHFAVRPLIALLSPSTGPRRAKICTALLLLNQVVASIEYKPLLNCIIEHLGRMEVAWECEVPEDVGTYSKQWKPFAFKSELDCTL